MDCHFEQKKPSEMDNAFALLNKYVKAKNEGEQLILVNTGGNDYVLGLRKKDSGAYSALSSNLTKKEMSQSLWEITKIFSAISSRDLELK